MTDYLIKEDVFMALTGDITDCTIEEFIARLRDKLSKLPSVNTTTNNDCISRQAVLDGLASIAKVKARSDSQKSLMGRVIFFVEQLPSVTPKEKIIHCKDCKYRDYWGDCNKWSKELNAHKTYLLDENMFCGFAERK